MFGLVVLKGHGRHTRLDAAKSDPRGRFQMAYVNDWLSKHDQSADHWAVLGQSYGRPINASHPTLQQALLLSVDAKKPIVIDNALRLFDYADIERALAFYGFLKRCRYPIISALHSARLHEIDEGLFTAMLADRLHHERERQLTAQYRAGSDFISDTKRTRIDTATEASFLDREVLSSRYLQLNTYRLCLAWQQENKSPPYSISALADGLNENGILADSSRTWTPQMLRRRLNALRGKEPANPLFEMIEKHGSRLA